MTVRIEAAQIPEALAALAAQARVFILRAGPPRKSARSVVYWMQRALRVVDNPALDVAIEAANILGLPVVVYFGVIPNYPNANLRHYHFLQQGLRDAAEDAAERGMGFVVRRSPDTLESFLEEVEAALLIGDENPAASPNAGAAYWLAGSRSRTGQLTPTSSSPRASSTAVSFSCITSARISKRRCPGSSSRRPRSPRPAHGSPTRHSSASPFRRTSQKGLRNSTAPSSP